jgi:hypothetical protein
MWRPPSERGVRLVLLLCAAPLLLVFPYLGATRNPNENVRAYMTMAIVEAGTIRIDSQVERYGWINDMANVPGPAEGEAHYISVKAPAVSLAGVPVYWAFRKLAPRLGLAAPLEQPSTAAPRAWFGGVGFARAAPEAHATWLRDSLWALRLLTVQLPCLLFLVWLERYLRAFSCDPVIRLCAVVAAGLGTNYLAYAHMYASHAPFAIAAFGSFALAERELRTAPDARARRLWCAALSGWLAGLCVLLEYHALPAAAALALFGVAVFHRPSRLLAFVSGGLFHVAVMMLFQWRAYRDPFTPGHKFVEVNRQVAFTGLFGVQAPSWEPFRDLSFDPGFGFFGTSPYMALGLAGVLVGLLAPRALGGARRRLRASTLGWTLAMLALWMSVAGAIGWRGGWTVGPRYLGAAPPFFALGAVVALEALARRGRLARALAQGAGAGLALASVVAIGITGILYDTLPEYVTRPLTQFTLPLARLGFVPHHVGEWLGWDSSTPWYLVLGALLAAPLGAALPRFGARALPFVARLAVLAPLVWAGTLPARSKADKGMGPDELRAWMLAWEPAGRDRLSVMRRQAQRGDDAGGCAWHRIAELERAVGLEHEAARDAAHARVPPERCPRRWWP